MLPNINTLGLAAILSPIFLFFKQIRSYIGRIFSFIVRTDSFVYISSQAQKHLLDELIKNSKQFKIGNKKYSSSDFFIRPLNRFDCFTYSFQEKFWILYKNKIPVFLDLSRDGAVKITYLVKTLDIPKMLAEAMKKSYQDTTETRSKRWFFVTKRQGNDSNGISLPSLGNGTAERSNLSFNNNDSGSLPPDRFIYLSQENLPLVDPLVYSREEVGRMDNTCSPNYYWSPTALAFCQELEYWVENQSFFTERSLPYRRGVLLSGQPGTGKSKLVYNACEKLKVPLLIFNISRMTNDDFTKFLEGTPRQSVVLIEDIDTVFNGRNNILDEASLTKNLITFDCLINSIGGAQSFDGRFIVVTTNNIEKLDAALLRPGRLDTHLQIGNIGREGREYIASNILKGFPELIKLAIEQEDCPAAQFENYCIELATAEFWKNKK